MYFNSQTHSSFISKSKTVSWLSPVHKEGNEPCFI